MSDLEARLRQDLNDRAAAVGVQDRPPVGLVARVRRRRLARMAVSASLVAVVALALLAGSLRLDGNGDRTEVATSPERAGLLASPPALTGSIVANVSSQPCPGFCGPFRFDLASPGSLARIDIGTWAAVYSVLADGRYAVPENGQQDRYVLVDPAGGVPPLLGNAAGYVDLLPDGRVVLVATDASGRRVLRKVDPKSGAFDDRRLSDWKGTAGPVAVGPDGSVAILRFEYGCCDQADVLIVRPDGKERSVPLKFPTGRRLVLGVQAAMSWGASGLLAISGQSPAYVTSDPHPGWTNVVDPATGHLVASLRGWQGLAWSPDGKGLLTAQRDGPDASVLAVWWGPGSDSGSTSAEPPERPCRVTGHVEGPDRRSCRKAMTGPTPAQAPMRVSVPPTVASEIARPGIIASRSGETNSEMISPSGPQVATEANHTRVATASSVPGPVIQDRTPATRPTVQALRGSTMRNSRSLSHGQRIVID